MGDLLDIASVALSASQNQLQRISHNVSNASTTGYKRAVGLFDSVSLHTANLGQSPAVGRRDMSPAALRSTGNPFDLAISGEGMFLIRGGSGLELTRNGQFQRRDDGAVVGIGGGVLQFRRGGDVIVGDGDFEVLVDGMVLDDGAPIGFIGVGDGGVAGEHSSSAGVHFAYSPAVDGEPLSGSVRQGFVETSNTRLELETIEMMAAVRQAELASRLVQTYDALVGQASTAFGRGV